MKKFVVFLFALSVFLLGQAGASAQNKGRVMADHGGAGMDRGVSYSQLVFAGSDSEDFVFTGNPLDYVYVYYQETLVRYNGRSLPLALKFVGFRLPDNPRFPLREAVYTGDFAGIVLDYGGVKGNTWNQDSVNNKRW